MAAVAAPFLALVFLMQANLLWGGISAIFCSSPLAQEEAPSSELLSPPSEVAAVEQLTAGLLPRWSTRRNLQARTLPKPPSPS